MLNQGQVEIPDTARSPVRALTMYQVDAFSDRVLAGNAAAIIITDSWLPDHLMQAIAEENNLAETAFCCIEPGGWRIRWFTPAVEVDFCGHATIAAAHVLNAELGLASPIWFQSRVGPLRVDREKNLYVLDAPCIEPESIGRLPSPVEELISAIAIQRFRNFENFFVEVIDEDRLRSFVPDLQAIASLGSRDLAITAPGKNFDFVTRYFAPGAGIPEDPVTGSIHATLAPYWAPRLGKTRFRAFQASARGGIVICEHRGDRVRISGSAVTFMTATIFVPADIVRTAAD